MILSANQAVQLPYVGKPYDLLNSGSNTIYYGDVNVSASHNVGSIAPGATVVLSSQYYIISPSGPSEAEFNPDPTSTPSGSTGVVGEFVAPSGGDDTTTLATAVVAVGVGGKVVLQPGGTYHVTTALNGALQPADKVEVDGNGATITVANNPSTGNSKVFGVSDNQSLYLRELIFQGPATWNAAGDAAIAVGINGASAAPNEIVCTRCKSLGMNFPILARQGIRGKLVWEGGVIDGQGVGATQDQCQGLSVGDIGAGYAGPVIVQSGTIFKGLGSSTSAGRSQGHAVYVTDLSPMIIRGAFFYDLMYGEVITHHTAPNSSPPADSLMPYAIISDVWMQGGVTGFVGIQANYLGTTVIKNCVIDHQTPLQIRGGVTKVSNCQLRNNFSGTASGGLVQFNVPAGIGATYLMMDNCDLDCTNANVGVYNAATNQTCRLNHCEFYGMPNTGNADIVVQNAGATIYTKGCVHRGGWKALKATAGTLISVGNHYLNGDDAIYVPTANTVARVISRSDEFSTSGGNATGLHYAGTVTTESHKDYYGTNAPASET